MKVPLELAFDGVETTDWAEELIRKKARRLDRLYGRLTACRVRVRPERQHHQDQATMTVHVELSVPGKTLMVTNAPHRPEESHQNPNLAIAIRAAFDAAERQLKTFKEQMRGEVKRHDVPFRGQIVAINPEADHGFLLTKEGGQLYFHRNSVMDADFDDLKQGDLVHYVEAAGDTGPTASKVWLAS